LSCEHTGKVILDFGFWILDFGFWIEEGVQRFLEIAKSLISFYNSFGNAISMVFMATPSN
jgi:hypothetical protein